MGEMIESGAADPHSDHVLAFCEEVAPGSALAVVPCLQEPGAAMADCFVTVADKVRAEGGDSVIGWAIWEAPGKLIEAEFHAVWRQPSGALLDVAARPMFVPSITFLADPGRTYKGQQVDNVRRPLSRDPRVRELIYLQGRRFAMLNAGARADQHAVVLGKREQRDYDRMMDRIERLQRSLFRGTWRPME